VILLSWLACGEPVLPVPPPPQPSPAAPAAVPSLYELAVPLSTSDGRQVGLDVHHGHATLVTMFYASCRSACPMLVQRVRAFEDTLDPETRAELRVLLVSLDPARDDPAALAAAASNYGVDPERWVLATPPPDQVREVAAVLGVQYKPTNDGEMHHSSILVLVDAEGREVARAEATSGDLQGLRDALR
jgi:protein SCO1/2